MTDIKTGSASAQADAIDTQSHRLAQEYLKLGGQRRLKMDDNITNVRQWEQDPPEAERFWTDEIETLSEDERKQVEEFLPSINTI